MSEQDIQSEPSNDDVKRVHHFLCGNHILVLSRVWIITQICVLALVISGFAVGAVGDQFNLAFIGVVVAILTLFMSIAGAVILRRYRTPQHFGFLLGASFMMSFIMLISAVAFGTPNCSTSKTAASISVFWFCIVLMVLYLVFSIMLFIWRREIIVLEEEYDDMDGFELNEPLAPVPEPSAEGEVVESRDDLRMV